MDSRLEPNVSYNDLVGNIAIDFPGDSGDEGFDDYAKGLGIDLQKFKPIGIRFYDLEFFGTGAEFEVHIYAISIEKEKENSEKGIDQIPTVEFKHFDKFENLIKYLHRLDAILFERFIDKEKIKIIDSIELETPSKI